MKNLIKMMLAASAVTVGAVSCDRDKGNEYEDGGAPATVGIVFQVPSAGLPSAENGTTRAPTTNDANAKAEETTIKTADVFIYSGNGDFLSHTALTPTDFNEQNTNSATAGSGYDEYASTKQISTTTGVKNFFVGINLPASVSAAMVNQPMSSAATVSREILRSQIVIATTGLPMFNQTGPTQATLVEGTANVVTVKVERLVSKITVEKAADMKTDGGTPGSIGNMTWAVNHTNKKVFLQQGTAAVYADPNWTAAQYDATHFEAAVDPADYVAVNDPGATTATYNAQYAIENTSEGKLQRELTRVTVRAPFAPAAWVPASATWNAGQEPQDQPNPNYVSGGTSTYVDFWVVLPPGGTRRFFAGQSEADRYATEKSTSSGTTVTAVRHPGGVCYWNFWVNTTLRGGENLRNEYYRARIDSVVAPGNATDAVPNETDKVPTQTNVTATVQIMNWMVPDMEGKNLTP